MATHSNALRRPSNTTPHSTKAAHAMVVLLTILAAQQPTIAQACSLEPAREHLIDSTIDDQTPPGDVENVSIDVRRGVGPQSDGCDEVATSCDDLGTVSIDITAPTDDLSGADEIGYVLELASGTLPSGLGLPTEPVRSPIVLSWIDGATDEQESVEFSIQITPMDKAGNLGATSAPIRVADPGSDGGCHQSGNRAAGNTIVWFMLGGAILIVRRRFFAPTR